MADADRGAAATFGVSRHQAREAALQMLYQWEIGRIPIGEVIGNVWHHRPDPESDVPVFAEAPSEDVQQLAAAFAGGVVANVDAIDPVIAEAAEHWRIERMTVMDRLILRLAVYEFRHIPETPARVVINEALELARTFSTEDAVRFINGILDGIRRSSERA